MRDFRELLESDRAHVFDGAMGTMLYARGVYINRSFDELNLTSPDLVLSVHREYVRAGAEILETNTYGANSVKLAGYGLDTKVRGITRRAAEIAREAAGESVYVAGAIGPLGIRIEPYGPTSEDEARAIFRESAEGLVEGGVDLFVLETFRFARRSSRCASSQACRSWHRWRSTCTVTPCMAPLPRSSPSGSRSGVSTSWV